MRSGRFNRYCPLELLQHEDRIIDLTVKKGYLAIAKQVTNTLIKYLRLAMLFGKPHSQHES